VIRPATAADAAAIAAVYAPYVRDTAISFEEVPPDAEEVAARMVAGLPWLVADDGGVVGFAFASPHRARSSYRWSVDVSVYVAPGARGRGLGSALYGELLPLVTGLGYVSAYAGITLPNHASVRLHERHGFQPVGIYRAVGFKLGAWHDVGWWGRRLQEPPAAPADPRAWDGRLG